MRERRTERPDAAGFTLVELIVVLGIILVLAGAMVPALGAFRRGQRLESAAKMVQAALNEVRRRAITTHARHVVVLFSFDETIDSVTRTRHGVATYSAPIGRTGEAGFFAGGYVGKALVLPAGVRFAQERQVLQVFQAVDQTSPSEPLPGDSPYFRKRNPDSLEFRPDGSVADRQDISGTEPAPPGQGNVFLPEDGYYQVPDGVRADLVLIETTPEGNEIVSAGKSRRVLVDLNPLTGRTSSQVFDVSDTFATFKETQP